MLDIHGGGHKGTFGKLEPWSNTGQHSYSQGTRGRGALEGSISPRPSPGGFSMDFLRLFVVVSISAGAGLCLGSLLAASKICGLEEELAHLWDVVKAAGLIEEGDSRGE